jgi:hypothetical protein
MKHLKIYEDNKISKYAWSIKSRKLDVFAASLINIGMDDEELEFWIDNRWPKYIWNYDEITIFHHLDNNIWTWSPSDQFIYDTEFKGDVIPTEENLEEWYIKNEMKKFNL